MNKLYIILLGFALIGARTLDAWELRGAWIHSPIGIEDKRGWDATVKALAENGYNALFANFAWAGCADYPSSVVEPHPSLYDADGNCRDLLQECLDACEKHGIQLHVWIVVCNLGKHTPERVRKEFSADFRVQLDSEGADSEYLAPHLIENQELVCNLAAEIATRYPVAGIHLDYIRYPFGNYDFSPSAREAFEKSLGHAVKRWPQDAQKGGADYEAFLEWRRGNITALVRKIHAAVKEVRPELQLTAAVYGYWPGAKVSVAQEAECWAKEGRLDALCPMNYSKNAEDAAGWLRQQLKALDGALPVYAGLANYMTETPQDLMAQIHDAFRIGADGFITFQLKPDFANDWLPELHREVTRMPATPPPRGNEPRPTAVWKRPPRILPWRFLRYWKRGDSVVCTMKMPDGFSEIERKSLEIKLLHNYSEVASCPLRLHWRKDGSLRMEFTPEQRGYYRWELAWRDSDGLRHEWRSQSRFVH